MKHHKVVVNYILIFFERHTTFVTSGSRVSAQGSSLWLLQRLLPPSSAHTAIGGGGEVSFGF